jgi:hypothetical protein
VPTVPIERVPSKVLVFAARVDRLAGLALECLAVAPDREAIALAAEDIVQIKALAAGVRR